MNNNDENENDNINNNYNIFDVQSIEDQYSQSIMKENNFYHKPILSYSFNNENIFEIKEKDFDINVNEKDNKENVILNCENEKCKEVQEEIFQIEEDIQDLKKKILMIDKNYTEKFIDISSNLSKVCSKIDEIQPFINHYQGNNLEELNYETLNFYENKLMQLLLIVKKRTSEIELNIMNESIKIPDDNSNLCLICKKNLINCLIFPCNHVVICCYCANLTTKCPVCEKFIEYYDKIFLPN